VDPRYTEELLEAQALGSITKATFSQREFGQANSPTLASGLSTSQRSEPYSPDPR
jgi:hypothetical protein